MCVYIIYIYIHHGVRDSTPLLAMFPDSSPYFTFTRFRVRRGAGKVAWTESDVRSMAVAIKHNLPVSVNQLLCGDDWKGGPLIQLEDTLTSARADDLILNHCWVGPVVRQFKDRVPSQFYLTDVFICLHKIFMNKLLIPLEEGDDVQSLARNEAKKVNCLISGLRALWRSSTLIQSLYETNTFIF